MLILLLALLSAQAHGCNFVDTPNPPCVPKSKVTARLHQLLRSVTASKQPQQTRNGFTSIGIQAAKSRNLPEAVAHFRASAFYKPGEPQSLENLALILRDTALTLVNKGKKQRKSAWRMLSEAVACYELVFYLRNKPIANNGQMKGTYALVSVLFGLVSVVVSSSHSCCVLWEKNIIVLDLHSFNTSTIFWTQIFQVVAIPLVSVNGTKRFNVACNWNWPTPPPPPPPPPPPSPQPFPFPRPTIHPPKLPAMARPTPWSTEQKSFERDM